MSAWVLLTIAGAFLQNFRSLLQRQLTEDLSVNGAAYVRFLFALPFAWLFKRMLLDAFLNTFSGTFLVTFLDTFWKKK